MTENESLQLKGIIFDVDGTLADTEEMHRRAFNESFKEFRVDWHWSVATYTKLLYISGGKERITSFGKSLRKNFSSDAGFISFVSDMHNRKGQIYRQLVLKEKISLRPGVERLIMEGVNENLSLNIATSSSFENIDLLLKQNLGPDWPSLFNVIESSDTTKEKKPNPAVYENVLRKSGLKAEEAIAIEDTQNGLAAAVRASIKTIVTVHPMTAENPFFDSCLVIDCMGEPDLPFNVISGRNFDQKFLDLSLMKKLLNK